MRCSQRALLSRWLRFHARTRPVRPIFFTSSYVSPSLHPAAIAPAAPVAELGVVRRRYPSPVNESHNEPSARNKPEPLSQGNTWIYAVIPVGLGLVFGVTWPLRNVALVYWLHGRAGYQDQGIRVVKGKPTRLSTGEPVPDIPDLVTGASAFLIAMFTAVALVIFTRRLYVRYLKPNARNA